MRSPLLSLLVFAFVAACTDPTPPADVPETPPPIDVPGRPPFPLAGTYDVQTTLDTFVFETAGSSHPDCQFSTLYCYHTRGANGATLSGTLVIVDTAIVWATRVDYPDARGSFTGRFCNAIDFVALTGCLGLGASMSLDVRGAFRTVTVEPPDSGVLGNLVGPSGPAGPSATPIISFSEVRRERDSLTGRVYWALIAGRGPPAYYGTFVARRRR